VDPAARIAQSRQCPFCNVFIHWSKIVVRDGVIENIAEVPMGRRTFERVNLLPIDVLNVTAKLMGQPAREL
jgi:hypothetical protein